MGGKNFPYWVGYSWWMNGFDTMINQIESEQSSV